MPAYCIFNNAQLNDIVSKKPSTKEELSKISGFGEKKVASYGESIIEIVSKTK